MARSRGRFTGRRSAPAVVALWLMGGALLCAGSLQAQPPGPLFTVIPSVDMFKGSGQISSPSFGGNLAIFCNSLCELVASAGLPHGARVVGIEIDACLDAPGDSAIHYYLVRRQGAGAGLELVVEGVVTDTGCSYRTAVPAAPIVVDSFSTEYMVLVRIGSLLCGQPGQSACPDGGSRVQAMRVYYEPSEGGVVEPTKRSGFSPF